MDHFPKGEFPDCPWTLLRSEHFSGTKRLFWIFASLKSWWTYGFHVLASRQTWLFHRELTKLLPFDFLYLTADAYCWRLHCAAPRYSTRREVLPHSITVYWVFYGCSELYFLAFGENLQVEFEEAFMKLERNKKEMSERSKVHLGLSDQTELQSEESGLTHTRRVAEMIMAVLTTIISHLLTCGRPVTVWKWGRWTFEWNSKN